MPQPATLVEGKYEVLAKIREGGMGTIYKVRHRLLDEIRVIKVMRQSVATSKESRRRFLDEARTATRLKHPNICAIHDFALDADGVAYLVMEYIDGVTLADLLKAQGALKVPLTLEITHQTLLALAYLHRKRIVHRDIAPDNLMLAVDDEQRSVVKLIDLGIAKVLDRDSDMTATGIFLGKLRYASPEQYGVLPSGETIDGRSDLYSTGLVLYELLTGKRPFLGETPNELMHAHTHGSPVVFEAGSAVPEDVRQIVLKALQRNRADRFPSAEAFDRDVAAALERAGRRKAGKDETTLIAGARTQSGPEGVAVTPSAEDRLNLQFSAQPTPNPGSPGPHGSLEEKSPAPPPSKPRESPPPPVASGAKALLADQREEEAWKDASGKGTAPVLRKFLESFPSGRYHQQAQRLLRELAEFEQAGNEGRAGYERFLQEHPSSRHAKSARDRLRELEEAHWLARIGKDEEALNAAELGSLLTKFPAETTTVGSAAAAALLRVRKEVERRKEQEEDAAWVRASEVGTEAAWEEFLANHRDSARREEATRRLDEARDFREASSLNTHDGWTSFQWKWADGQLREAALARLEEVKSKIQEALGRAEADGSAAAYRAFLEAHGSTHLTSRAKSLLAEQTDFDAVQAHDTEDAWRGFLERWPAGLRIAAATRRLEAAREREEQRWQEAGQDGAAPALLGFLQAFPSGKHHREAEGLLRELTELGEATKQGRAGIERFLREHPRSRYANAARARLHERKQVRKPAVVAARVSPPAPEPQVPASPRRPSLDDTLKAEEVPARSRTTVQEPDADPEPVPAARTGRILAIAVAIPVAVVGLWLWFAPRTASRVQPTQARAQPPPIAALGDLAINVLPRGRVDRIEDSDGKKWQDGLPRDTPLVVRLPPGKYSVFVSNPNYRKGITIAVEVRAGQRAVGSGRFE